MKQTTSPTTFAPAFRSSVSRRAPLTAIFFAALAGTLGVGGCVEPDRSVNSTCPTGQSLCGSACRETVSDPAHCGSCGQACPGGALCSTGECKSQCDPGLSQCGAACVDPLSSEGHCGMCDHACAPGATCTNRVCVCPVGEASCGGGVATGGGPGTGGASGTGGAGSAAGVGGAGSGASTGGALASGGAGSGGASGGSGGASTGGAAGSGGMGTGGMGAGGVVNTCTNILPTGTDWPEATCDMWHDAGNCDDAWFVEQDACNESCGRCTSSGAGGASGTGGGTGTGGAGTGNPYGGVTNPEGEVHSTRYWDCCKPSCGWTSQGNIHTCDLSNNDIGVNDQVKSVCDTNPQGQGQTCHGMAPWAYSSELAFGFVAANGRDCGSCYKLEFTGPSQLAPGDAGATQIAGQVMIVKVSNRGAELGDGHFDILMPGGGLGAFNGCSAALGIAEGDLGARNGGFITSCNGDLACIRNECTTTFANFPELRDGCLWSVDWFKGANNPKFKYQRVDCPQELEGFN